MTGKWKIEDGIALLWLKIVSKAFLPQKVSYANELFASPVHQFFFQFLNQI